MTERRFFRAGEYELFLDEDIYNAFLNESRRYSCVYVMWRGWHRAWQPSREAGERMRRGALFRNQSGHVMLDLLVPECLPGRYTVKLYPVCSSDDFISFVVRV